MTWKLKQFYQQIAKTSQKQAQTNQKTAKMPFQTAYMKHGPAPNKTARKPEPFTAKATPRLGPIQWELKGGRDGRMPRSPETFKFSISLLLFKLFPLVALILSLMSLFPP